jgi:hypothetical protein
MFTRRINKLPIGNKIMPSSYLRWIGGGSYLDIRLTAGISVTVFYQCIIKCTKAIDKCQQLAYHFPTSDDKFLQPLLRSTI